MLGRWLGVGELLGLAPDLRLLLAVWSSLRATADGATDSIGPVVLTTVGVLTKMLGLIANAARDWEGASDKG